MSEEKQSSKKGAEKALHKRLKAEKKDRKSAKKEEKKALREEKKKRKRSEEADDTATDDVQAKEDKKKEKKSKTKSDDKDERKKERAAKKAAKKAEQAALLEKVPKVDEHGISYTKIQIRRMARRAKRGLPPVPTEEEEREMLRQKKLDKEEEEQELAGLLHRSNREDEDEDSGEESEGDGDEDDEVADDGEDDDEEDIAGNQEDDDDDGSDEKEPASQPRQHPTAKKCKRSKPVPPDYTCMACQNRHSPAHWIYDCPEKERRPGSNHVKKKLRGLNLPSSCKVFVSGLPFEIKSRDVEKYFATSCGKVVHCKLLTFEDTKRCKGQAFVTFEEEESAKKALKMTGEVLDYEPEDSGKKKKKSKGDAEMPKKALTLRVSKVKSRIATGGRKY